jgi:hypothetical protein
MGIVSFTGSTWSHRGVKKGRDLFISHDVQYLQIYMKSFRLEERRLRISLSVLREQDSDYCLCLSVGDRGWTESPESGSFRVTLMLGRMDRAMCWSIESREIQGEEVR